MIRLVPPFALGVVGWTLLEYLLHRFAMHELRGRGLASREHLAHHADVRYFARTRDKALTAVGVSAVFLPTAWWLASLPVAVAFVGGLLSMYSLYELLHRRAHTHPPRTAYGRWLRRSHFYHHFGHPRRNHGVTTPVWDMVFRTYIPPGRVKVPRRLAMGWLIDAEGNPKTEFADDYELVGAASDTDVTRARDRADAFANRVPSPD